MADRIIVDFEALERISSRLNAAGQELDQAMSKLARLRVTRDAGADVRISGCGTRLRTTGMTVSAGTVGEAVSSYKSAVGNVSSYANNLGAAVRNAYELFERTENSLSGKKLDAGESAPTSEGAESGAPGKSIWDYALDYFKKALGKAGILGTIASAVWSGATSGKSTFEVLATYLAKTVPAYVKWAKSDDYIKQLLGLQKFLKTPATEGPKWARMASDFGSGLKKGLTSGPAWIAAGVSCAFSNYHEYASGAISGDRAVVETITETAGTVVINAAIAAGVAAVIPAAPAVAVGVVAAGIFYGADQAVKFFTHSDKGIVEHIGTWTGDLYDGVKETFKSAGATVVNGWNAFSRSVSSVFSRQPMLAGGGGSW